MHKLLPSIFHVAILEIRDHLPAPSESGILVLKIIGYRTPKLYWAE